MPIHHIYQVTVARDKTIRIVPTKLTSPIHLERRLVQESYLTFYVEARLSVEDLMLTIQDHIGDWK